MRWIRGVGRLAGAGAWAVALLPALMLAAAPWVDRGPDGASRLTVFPAALAALDPFVWTCARNSLLVAAVTTFAARIVGVGLARVVARWRFWGRLPLAVLGGAAAVVPPAFGAVGLRALGGPPELWPLPRGWEHLGPSLGLAVWAWLALTTGAPLVALATTAALARVDPSWEDAARLEGASRRRVWRQVVWPVVRPDVARALALVFTLTLLEPGAPLVLGLRRTLGYQVVASALDGGPGALGRASALALGASALVVVVRVMIGWWGGVPVPSDRGRASRRVREPAGWARGAACAGLLAAAAGAAWLPTAGLVSAASGSFGTLGRDLPARGTLRNAAALGLAVVAFDLVMARALASFATSRRGRWLVDRLASYPLALPPLAVGVGVLATPGVIEAVANALPESTARPSPGELVVSVAEALDPGRVPWVGLVVAVGLVRLPLLARSAVERRRGLKPAWVDAAVTLGATPRQARRTLSGRWLGVPPSSAVLTLALAATGVTPALLFAPTADTRPVGPAVLTVADEPGDGLARASALAVAGVGLNLLALAASARGRSGLPRPWSHG